MVKRKRKQTMKTIRNHQILSTLGGVCAVAAVALLVAGYGTRSTPPSHAATGLGPQVGTSNFHTGDDVQQNSYVGNVTNATQASNLINASTSFVNIHLMGSGMLRPQACPYAAYDWGQTGSRMDAHMAKLGTPETVVFQAFQAPTWMLTAGNPTPSNCTTDFSKLGPPTPDHYGDYANLVAATVQHYPQIQYVEVWNEFSGFFIGGAANTWDYQSYTNLYNAVYDKVHATSPNVKIGGPYIVIGSNGGTHSFNSTVGGAWGKFDQRVLNSVMYWLQNKHGADFLTVDGSSNNYDAINPAGSTEFSRLDKYPDFFKWVRSLNNTTYPGAATIPLWQAEWYAMTNSSSDSFTKKTAYVATGEIRSLKAGVSNLMLWGTEGCIPGSCAANTAACSAINDQIPVVMPAGYDVNGLSSFYCNPEQLTSSATGAPQTTELYTLQKDLHDYFSAGTALYDEGNTNNNVETLSSATKVLLVNNTASAQTASVYGTNVALTAYEVKLVDVPTIPSTNPDLVVSSVSTSPAVIQNGDAVTFSAVIKNQGTAATPAGTIMGVNFSINGTSVNWNVTTTASLAAGASTTITANSGVGGSTTWPAVTGTYTLLATVDGVNRIPELDETNNSLANTITVVPVTNPDLIITSVATSPTLPKNGDAVTFSAVVKNQGTAATSAGAIIGVNFSINGTSVNWNTTTATSLAAGASMTITANSGSAGVATWPAVTGTYTLLATVDGPNRIPELDETNNDYTSSLIVAPTTPTPKPGDTNGDGFVNTQDIANLVKHWGQTVAKGTNGDLSGNGIVDTPDISILVKYWGT